MLNPPPPPSPPQKKISKSCQQKEDIQKLSNYSLKGLHLQSYIFVFILLTQKTPVELIYLSLMNKNRLVPAAIKHESEASTQHELLRTHPPISHFQ